MPVSADDFRAALRRFASGVTVVTVAIGDHLHGMTASSFASVSLEPPLVLVCLSKTSRTRAMIEEKGSFAVNILSEGQAEVARVFARAGVKPFDELPHTRGSDGEPLLDDAIACIECRTNKITAAGDHDVLFGEVMACTTRGGAPLLYYDQTYRGFSPR